jgi:WD40 repeat protein
MNNLHAGWIALGLLLAATSQTITLTNAAQMSELARYGRGVVNAAAWSPDGERLALATTLGVWLYEADDWDAEPSLLAGQEGALSVAFSPDGQQIAAGGEDASAAVWDVRSGARLITLTSHLYGVDRLAFSPGGDRLATSDPSGVLRLWSAATGAEVRVFQSDGSQTALAWSPNGGRLAASGAESVRVWSVEDGDQIFYLETDADSVLLSFDVVGERLVIGADGGESYRLDVWDGESVSAGQPAAGRLYALTFGADALPLPLVFDAGRIGRGEMSLVEGLTGEPPTLVSLAPQGDRLALVDARGSVHVWDTTRVVEVARLPRHTRTVAAVAFAPDAAVLIDDGEITRWLPDTDAAAPLLTSPPETVWSANDVTSPDGRLRAVGGDDGIVHLYETATGAEVGALRGHIRGITSVAFSPDGSLLASASLDGTIHLYGVAAGERVATLSGHHRGVTGVIFSADGTRLASSSFDGTVRLWGIDS